MTRHTPIMLPEARQGATPAEPSPLAVVLASWPRILLCVAIACLLGALYAYRIATPIYRTHVTLMLESRDTNVIDVGRVIPALGHDAQILNTQAAILRSRSLAGQLVDRLGLDRDPEFNPALRQPPAFAPHAALRGLLEDRGLLPPMAGHAPSAEAQRDAAVNTLIRALDIAVEPESLVFTLAIGTTDPVKSAEIVNTLAGLYMQDQVEAKLAATDQATVWLSERVVELRRTLEQAEAMARSARAERGLRGPDDLAEMERRLAALRQRLADPRLEPEAARRLDREGTALAAEIRAASEELVAIGQLEREAEATALLYESFLARLKETAIQSGVQRADARILSQAVVPLHPAHPKPAVIIVLAAILGAGLGTLWLLAGEAWRARFRSSDEAAQSSGLTVLAELPENDDHRRDPVADLTLRPGAPLSEALRGLRSSIQLTDLDNPPRVILLTSAVAGEGRTTLALLLAESLASWGKRVLLIEADTRRPAIAARLGVTAPRGVISVLAGLCRAEDIAFRPGGHGFDVLAGEATAANGADIFATGRFDGFLRQMRERYDHVVIDSPPVLEAADARIIATAADAVVFLMRWNRTTRQQMRRGLAQFRDYGLPVSGLVLTRMSGRRRIGHGPRQVR